MSDDKSIELTAVIERFSKSTKTLDDLSERISMLSNTSDALAKNTTGITEATALIQKFVTEVSTVTNSLRVSNTGIQQAVEAASKYLQGKDLIQMKTVIDQIHELLQKQLISVTAELQDARDRGDKIQQELVELKKKFLSLPSRVQKKFK